MVKIRSIDQYHYTLNINNKILEVDAKELYYLQVAIALYRKGMKKSVCVDFRFYRNKSEDKNKVFLLKNKDYEVTFSNGEKRTLYSRLNKINKANYKNGTLQIKNSKWNRDIVSSLWGDLKPVQSNSQINELEQQEHKKQNRQKPKIKVSKEKSEQAQKSNPIHFILSSSKGDIKCSTCNEKAAFVLATTDDDNFSIAFCEKSFEDFINVILDFYIFCDGTPTMFREGEIVVSYDNSTAKCLCCEQSSTMSFNFNIGSRDFSLCENDFEKLCEVVFNSAVVKETFGDKCQEFIIESKKKKQLASKVDK